MDEQVKERLVDSLDKVMQWAEGAEGFVLEQAPLVAQEIVAWQYYEGLFWAIAMAVLIAFLLSVAAIVSWTILARVENAEGRVFAVFPPVFAIIPGVPALICMCESSVQCIQACVAPRLVIIDYLGNLL